MKKPTKQLIIYTLLVVMVIGFLMLSKPRSGHNSIDPTPAPTEETVSPSPTATPRPSPPARTPEPEPTLDILSSGSDIVLITQKPATNSDIK